MAIEKVEEAEVDEMWSYVGNKKEQRWLWHAIDCATGATLAYVFGGRKDAVFLELKALLEPFGITRYYTDHLGRLSASSRPRRALPRQALHPANRTQAPHSTDSD